MCKYCGSDYVTGGKCKYAAAPAIPVDCMVVTQEGLSVEEIAKEFGDCDWMRAVFNTWTVDAILTLIAEAKRLKAENEKLKDEASARTKPYLSVDELYQD